MLGYAVYVHNDYSDGNLPPPIKPHSLLYIGLCREEALAFATKWAGEAPAVGYAHAFIPVKTVHDNELARFEYDMTHSGRRTPPRTRPQRHRPRPWS